MNNIIRRIEISGFRSLDSVQLICDEVNVYTGLNDVGKSNVLRALNLFFNQHTDLDVGINFAADYSKLSLAKAQKSAHQKQQIKIRIYFNAPSSFKSLQNEELWLERVYDRFERLSEKSSLDDSPKRASLTRLTNSIRYYYIPALKGHNVLEYILGEIGRRNLMSSDDIVELNKKVNNNIKDFAGILANSSINIKTNFELPVLVQDFWQRLNINTEFDEFKALNKPSPTPKGEDVKLREDAYQISLLARGEGLKSKYIPPLLKWIQEHEPSKHFIWGIDEPENSLEFKKAQEVADLYFDEYSKNTQIFLTSHSLAFIFPSNAKDHVTVFRCVKTGYGDISVRRLDDLFAEQSKLEIAEELGALEIQKQVVQEWREKEQKQQEAVSGYYKITKPTMLVEGAIDKDYVDHTLALFGQDKSYPFAVRMVGYLDDNGNDKESGKDALDRVWRLRHHFPSEKKVVLFYDVDCSKTVQTDKNMTVYCPVRAEGQIYASGIEHLICFPGSYDKNKYQMTYTSGDKTTFAPDKQAIKTYLFSLPEAERKVCLQKLYDTLVDMKQYAA